MKQKCSGNAQKERITSERNAGKGTRKKKRFYSKPNGLMYGE